MQNETLTKEKAGLPPEWEAWCQRGACSVGHKRRAVLAAMNDKKEVRGHYSDLFLDPNLPHTHSLYPSVDHTSFPKQNGKIVVECRIVNDMKSHLGEDEFWQAIEHLFIVGVAKEKILKSGQRRDSWLPKRHFGKAGTTE